MMNKFFRHGTGSGARAINYLLQANDHKNDPRAGIRVMRGDPERVAKLVDSLDFVHRYTSGVIAFHPDDEPTEDQVNEVLNEFERLAYAGLERDQYAFTVIEHVDEDGTRHYHTFGARVELRTGKSLNVAPPGWQKTFDHLVDHFNAKFGWRHPGNPENARDVQSGFGVYQKEFADLTKNENVLAALDVDGHPRLVLADMIEQRVRVGIIWNREDMIRDLSGLGDITRQGKNYISIRLHGESKNTRLKGTLFHEDFDAGAWLARSAEAAKSDRLSASERAARRTSRADPVTAGRSLERINECFERRKKHNKRVYRAASEQRQKTDHQDKQSFRKEPELTEVVDRQSAQGDAGDVDIAALKASEDDTVRFVDDHIEHILADHSDVRSGGDSLALYETAAEAESVGTDRSSHAERRQFDLSSSRKTQDSTDTRELNDHRVRELDSNGFEYKTIKNYRAGENADRQDQSGRGQAGYLDRVNERKCRQGSKVDQAVDRFIRSAETAVAACRSVGKVVNKALRSMDAIVNKLQQYSGLSEFKLSQKHKRSVEKYGKFWQRNDGARQRKERYYATQRENVREVSDVRTLSDQGLRGDSESTLSNRS